jgi:hypothetical protein
VHSLCRRVARSPQLCSARSVSIQTCPHSSGIAPRAMDRRQRDVRERHWIFVTSPGGPRQSLAIPTAIYPRLPERQV